MKRPMTLLRSLLGALVAVMLWLPAAGAVDIKAVTTPLGLTAAPPGGPPPTAEERGALVA